MYRAIRQLWSKVKEERAIQLLCSDLEADNDTYIIGSEATSFIVTTEPLIVQSEPVLFYRLQADSATVIVSARNVYLRHKHTGEPVELIKQRLFNALQHGVTTPPVFLRVQY